MSRIKFQERLDQIPEQQFLLFRSCIASNHYPGVETSIQFILEEIAIMYQESEDQTCCGSCVLFSSVGELQQSIPIAARNMAIGESLGGNILVSCNGCYKMLRETKRLIKELQLKKELNYLLNTIGRVYQGTATIYHVGELLYKKHATIGEHITRDVGNLTIAVQYGCHYLKSFHKSVIDDVKQPHFLEALIKVTGANPVEYPGRLMCCGAGATLRYLKRKNTLLICREKLKNIQEAGADAIVVICPYCLLHLDRAQQELKAVTGESFETPVIHISQLLALAMGMERKKLGFQAHITPVDSLLDKITA